jgi:hypothetical protein
MVDNHNARKRKAEADRKRAHNGMDLIGLEESFTEVPAPIVAVAAQEALEPPVQQMCLFKAPAVSRSPTSSMDPVTRDEVSRPARARFLAFTRVRPHLSGDPIAIGIGIGIGTSFPTPVTRCPLDQSYCHE